MLLFVQIPGGSDLYSYYVDLESKKLEPWDKIISTFSFNPEVRMVYWALCISTLNSHPVYVHPRHLSLTFWYQPLTLHAMDT